MVATKKGCATLLCALFAFATTSLFPRALFAQSSAEVENAAVLFEPEASSDAASLSELFEDEESDGIDSESDDDDFDSLFSDAEDVEEPVITDDVKAGTDYNVQLGSVKFPLELSGNLDAEFGGAYVYEDYSHDGNVYFDFKNYIYFTTRPDKYLALKGVLKTSMPDDSEDEESNQMLYLYEMYFEYLMLNHVYITAGKKKSVWGNVRLFSNVDDYENDTDALFTNILYDSRSQISGIMKIPVKNHTFTGVAMYKVNNATNKSPGTKDMSLAASAEFIVFNTAINFFGRRFPLSYSANGSESQSPILGVEIKRTLFGFDIYGQSLARVADGTRIKDVFTSKFGDLTAFDRIVSTVGGYWLWTKSSPYIGVNGEFQNIYRPEPSDTEKYFINRFAFEFGMARLGPKKNIRVGLQWNHNLTEHSGFIKPGIIFVRVMPHCDWKNGVKYEYTDNFRVSKLTIGTYLTISLDY